MPHSLPEENSPRQRIIDGARQAFLTFGYDGASMRTITEYTGYSQAGISHYFASKAELLTVTLNQSCDRVEETFKEGVSADSVTRLYKIWRAMSRHRTDLALRSVVLSESSITDHPATETAIHRIAALTDLIHECFPEIIEPQLMSDIWEGLIIDWLYRPRLDVPGLLRDAYFALSQWNETDPTETINSSVPDNWDETIETLFGQFTNAEPDQKIDGRRRTILDAAMQVFGDSGYVGGSLRTIANVIGVTHPALLRHYPSKDDLFQAVLKRHDVALLEVPLPKTPRESLAQLLMRADAALNVPGLVKLYTAVEARSYQTSTPFHTFFVTHTRSISDIQDYVFQFLGETDQIRADLSPIDQGRILLALWGGVQIRWALAPESISVTTHLLRYMDYFLVPPLTEEDLKITEQDWPQRLTN